MHNRLFAWRARGFPHTILEVFNVSVRVAMALITAKVLCTRFRNSFCRYQCVRLQERWPFAAYRCDNSAQFSAASLRLAADIYMIIITTQLDIELLARNVFAIELVFRRC